MENKIAKTLCDLGVCDEKAIESLLSKSKGQGRYFHYAMQKIRRDIYINI